MNYFILKYLTYPLIIIYLNTLLLLFKNIIVFYIFIKLFVMSNMNSNSNYNYNSNSNLNIHSNIKQICNKDNISLSKVQNDNDITFIIDFMIHNNLLDLTKILNKNIFELLFVLNKEVFDTFHIIDRNEDEQYIDMFISYKHFGSEYGIPKSCICFRLYYNYLENGIEYTSKSIECPQKYMPNNGGNGENGEKIEFIKDKGMQTLLFFSNDKNIAHITTSFTMEKDERIPIFMENIPGKLMKNVYLRLKTFIENLSNTKYNVE